MREHKGGIDPAWEYWTPSDPEIAELFGECDHDNSDFSRLDWDREDRSDRKASTGWRFGRGDPNSGFFREAPERKKVVRETKPKKERERHQYACWRCGQSLEPGRWGRWCSDECKRKGKPRLQPCHQCGEKYFRRRRHRCLNRLRQKFCSRSCHRVWMSECKKQSLADRPCKQCGVRFSPKETSIIYCSRPCVYAAQIKPLTQYRSGCPECGKPLVKTRYGGQPQIYCSKQCKCRASNRHSRERKRMVRS